MTRNGPHVRNIVLTILAWLLCLGGTHFAPAASMPSSSESPVEETSIGIQGLYKTGLWTNVRIRLKGVSIDDQRPVQLIVPDPEGVAASYIGLPRELGSPASREYEFLVRPGQLNPAWQLAYTAWTGEPVLERLAAEQLPQALASGTQTVVTIGSDLQITAALGLRSAAARDRVATRQLSSAEALPRHWLAYSGVDLVVLTSHAEWIDKIDALQWQALRRWVEMGGNLCVSVETEREGLFRASGPLAWTVPGDIRGVATMRQTTNLEQFAAASRRLDRSPAGESAAAGLKMLDLDATRGRIEFREGLSTESIPALIRHPVGFGRVTFLNLSLDAAPMASWADRPRLLARLLEYGLDAPLDDQLTGGEGGPTTHLGFTDLTGQLRLALEQFPGVRFVPFSWVAGVAIVYLLCAGPLEFWLLRKIRRLTWTWGFSLAIAGIFTAAILFLGSQGRSSRPLVNQLSIVDIDARSGLVRGTMWSHLYSPRTTVQDLRIEPRSALEFTEPFESILNWQGLPGNGFGGIDRPDSSESFATPYQVTTNAVAPDHAAGELREFPIAVWASRSISGQWWGKVKPLAAGDLAAGGESLLRGVVRNPLSVDLRNAYLVYDRWAYPLGTLAAGAELAVDESMAIDLQTVLTDRRIVDGRSVTPAWDRQSTNIERITQTLLFYAAAKGQQYTGLQHRHQRLLDWSDHVRLGQATLWGRANQAFAGLQSNGGKTLPAEDWTFSRILIPVREAKRGQP